MARQGVLSRGRGGGAAVGGGVPAREEAAARGVEGDGERSTRAGRDRSGSHAPQAASGGPSATAVPKTNARPERE
jgi:hypothetical protein